MKIVEHDLRRYVWSWGQVLYRLGILIPSYVEDADGAVEAGQLQVAVRACRDLGEECAVTWLLATTFVRPLPPREYRLPMAIEAVPAEMKADVMALVRGVSPVSPATVETLMEAGHRAAENAKSLIGSIPNILSPEGYFPALKIGGDWLRLAELVSEEDFLPHHWKPE
jgi:hypothetical protein